jgi:WS/DGAT/MGAT family acyltransferase
MSDLLSPMEAIMWRVGQDATLRMTVGALLVLDRPPDQDALSERLAAVAEQASRLRRRPDVGAGLRSRPFWVDDEDPAPDHHLRSLSVAEPGSMRQVLDLVGLLESIPFDPGWSPWDVTLIGGMADGKAVVYLRAHHVLTDGIGGIDMLELLLDESERLHGEAEPQASVPSKASEIAERVEPANNGDHVPGRMTITLDVPKAVRRVIDGVNSARDVDPVESMARAVQGVLGLANSVSRQLMVTGGPLSTLPEARSLLSRFELISVDGARSAALALGGSRNDLLVAAAAAGLGAYQAKLGQPVSQLRVATPTSQRRHREAGGNWFAPARLEVPTAAGQPVPQFGVVVERLAQARREPALRVASRVAQTVGRLPTRMLVPALHAQADSVDFAATALPGLRGDRHLCGSRIEGSYPLGPRLGCPMNISAFGNDGRLDVGVAIDPSAIPEPELLVECLTRSFDTYRLASRDRVSTESR